MSRKRPRIHQRNRYFERTISVKAVRPSRPLKRKIASETGSKEKNSVGSLYRKSDIAEAKISLQPELTQSSIESPSAEPRKNSRKSAHWKGWRRMTQMSNCNGRHSRPICHNEQNVSNRATQY